MRRFATIDEVCDLVTDGTHYTPKNVGEGIPFLTVKDVTDYTLDLTNCSFITQLDFETAKAGNSVPCEGDVLFSKDGTVGKVHLVTTSEPFAVLSSLAILRPKTCAIKPRYLKHALRSPSVLKDALKKKTGSAIRRIILSDLKRVRLFLPPLAEQKRIAAVLDKAEEVRSKRRTALAQLDTLTQSIFLEMFGDPISNEKRWLLGKVGDFVAGFESGKSLVADDEETVASSFRVLKVSAVTSLHFRPEESKALPPHYEPPKSHFVREGDLLFSRANTSELIGATAFVDQAHPNLVLSDKLWRFVWHEVPKADQHKWDQRINEEHLTGEGSKYLLQSSLTRIAARIRPASHRCRKAQGHPTRLLSRTRDPFCLAPGQGFQRRNLKQY